MQNKHHLIGIIYIYNRDILKSKYTFRCLRVGVVLVSVSIQHMGSNSFIVEFLDEEPRARHEPDLYKGKKNYWRKIMDKNCFKAVSVR